eukprot:RCo008217
MTEAPRAVVWVLLLALVGLLMRLHWGRWGAQPAGLPVFHSLSQNGTCFHAMVEWRKTYAPLHAAILSGVRPLRLAVAVLPQAGIADQLTGVLTLFYYALFTERAFQIITYGVLPDFSMAFDSPVINWTASYPDVLFEHLKFSYKNLLSDTVGRLPEFRDDARAYTFWFLINNCTAADEFGTRNFSTIGPLNGTAPYAFLSSNRGRSY